MNLNLNYYSILGVTFESTEKEIDSWDVKKAMEMARSIKERHGATPYGFRFSTRERRDDELDSKTVAHSGMYFLARIIM